MVTETKIAINQRGRNVILSTMKIKQLESPCTKTNPTTTSLLFSETRADERTDGESAAAANDHAVAAELVECLWVIAGRCSGLYVE